VRVPNVEFLEGRREGNSFCEQNASSYENLVTLLRILDSLRWLSFDLKT
jgi:hypothetical protein